MPILEKDIVPEGNFLVSSPVGRIPKEFSRAYLEKVASTANQMIAAGLKIPAPFDHSSFAIPHKVNEPASSAYNNAGYWLGFTVGPNSKGKLALKGFVDLPGDEKDSSTPYYKALNTAKEVSLNIRDTFQDGLGRVWKDALLHAALVNHAIVPDQDEFKKIAPEGSSIINMSMESPDEGVETLISGLIESLKTNLEINLMPTDDIKTFLRDLRIAVLNIPARATGGQSIEPVPIYMGYIPGEDTVLTKEQAEGLVATKAVNPATKLPYTMEDFGFKKPEDVKLSAVAAENETLKKQLADAATALKALLSKVATDTSKTLGDRIQRLVGKVITQEYADKHLAPLVSVSMSIEDGKFGTHPLEVTLSALEAAAAALPAKANESHDAFNFPGTIEVPPLSLNGNEAELSDADLQAAIESTIKFAQV